jgi:hypothetical protein
MSELEGTKMNYRFYQEHSSVNGKAKIQTGYRSRANLVHLLITACFFIIVSIMIAPLSVKAAENNKLPAYGKGPAELIIFTDYFCEPCQKTEKELDSILEKHLEKGEIKIIFVDIPIQRNLSSPVFTKYFLYAAQSEGGYANAVKARKFLLRMARQDSITESAIEKTFKIEGIAFKIFDHKKVLVESKILINRYKVTKAPAYVLKQPQKEARKFTDQEQIRKVLLPELQSMLEKPRPPVAKPTPNKTKK